MITKTEYKFENEPQAIKKYVGPRDSKTILAVREVTSLPIT